MTDESPPPSDDAVSIAFELMCRRLAEDVLDTAAVTRDGHPGTWSVLYLTPHNRRAVGAVAVDRGDSLGLNLVGPAAGWDIDRTHAGVRHLESALRAVVAGRLVERSTYGHWRVELASDPTALVFDGETPAELLPHISLQRLRARWRGPQTRTYEPY